MRVVVEWDRWKMDAPRMDVAPELLRSAPRMFGSDHHDVHQVLVATPGEALRTQVEVAGQPGPSTALTLLE